MNPFILVLVGLCSAAALADHAFEQYTDIWRGYHVIPRQLMTADDLVSLGLENLAEESVPLKLSELGKSLDMMPSEKSPIVVPRESSLMLLFNSSRTSAAEDAFSAAFAQSSLPLSLPKFYYVMDLFLLIPSSSFSDTTLALGRSMPTADVWLHKFGLDRGEIPLAGSMIQQGKPFVAFIFQGGDDLRDFDSSLHDSDRLSSKHKISDAMAIPSNDVTKAVIASSNEFFDNFARVFVDALGYDKLFQAIFCEVNTQATEMSYCVRKTDTDTEVSVISHAPISKIKRDLDVGGNTEARLNKRLFWGSDDCDDDDDDDDGEEGFDWLNPYDYDYLMRSSMARKLKKMVSLIEFGLDDDDDDDNGSGDNGSGDNDDDDDDDDDDEFNDMTVPRFGGMDEFMEHSPYFQRDEDSEDLSLNDRLERLDQHQARKDDKPPGAADDVMQNKAPPPIFISTASVVADKDNKAERALKKLRRIRLKLENMEREDLAGVEQESATSESGDESETLKAIKKSTIPHITFRGDVHISDYARNLYKKLNTFITKAPDHHDSMTVVDEVPEESNGPDLTRLYGTSEYGSVDDGSSRAEVEIVGSEADNIEMTDEEMSEYLAMLEKDDAEYINKARLFRDPNAEAREAANSIKLKRSQSVLSRAMFEKAANNPGLQKRQTPDQSMQDAANECIEVTWKRVFTHALFGQPANFCTKEQLRAQSNPQN